MEKILYKLLDTPYIEYLVEKSAPRSREETLLLAEECSKYLSLSHFRPGEIPVSKEVDEIWHLLILETRPYKELCEKLPGKIFKHHCSAVYQRLSSSNDEKLSNDTEASRQLEWLLSYVQNFGDFTEEALPCWPYALKIMKKLNLNLSDFNQNLKTLLQKKQNKIH